MYIAPVDRYSEMIFNCLDDMVAHHNPVRILDRLIDLTLEKNPGKYANKGIGSLGRPAYSPSTMLKTLLYGLLNGINSIKRLEYELYINLELIWLTGNLHPDYNTIASFRKENKTLILQFCKDLKKLVKTDYDIIKESVIKSEKNDRQEHTKKYHAETLIQQISKAESILSDKEKPVKLKRKKPAGQFSLM